MPITAPSPILPEPSATAPVVPSGIIAPTGSITPIAPDSIMPDLSSGSAVIVAPQGVLPASSTPAPGVAGTNTLTFTSNVVFGEVIINGVRFEFDAGNFGPYTDLTIFTSGFFPVSFSYLTPAEAASKLATKINAYPSTGVTAVANGGIVTVTSITASVAANSITCSTQVSGASWATATLAGGSGVDTTPQGILPNSISSTPPIAPSPIIPLPAIPLQL